MDNQLAVCVWAIGITHVSRATERMLVPDRGASLGNFGVGTISKEETWVTVGECMYSPECEKRGSDGSVFAARIIWSKPNASGY